MMKMTMMALSGLAKAPCHTCIQEPKEVVETPCCGEVWCWQCAVDRPPKEDHCSRCGAALPLEAFRPAKAIEVFFIMT